MATAIKDELDTLRKKVSLFAQQNIAPRTDLHTSNEFPFDIWHKMSQEKLLGIGIPEEYGGLGGNCLSIAVAGEAMVRRGYNMGLALSWLMHQIVSRSFILRFGTSEQKNEYLHDLASGKLKGSVAISEPERGAHPKYLKTVAHAKGDSYVLNGKKYHVTNAPIADLFLVCAITGVNGSRKQFTMFIVPQKNPGLLLTEPMKLTFLRPCPHGGIILTDCLVPSSNILGEIGSAYHDMVVPLRELEDVLLMGQIVGGMERELEMLLGLIQAQHISATDELKSGLGELQSLAHTLRIVAYEAATMLDSDTSHPELHSLPLSFKSLAMKFQSQFELTMSKSSITSNTKLDLLANDVFHVINIAKNVTAIKQRKLGENLLLRKGRDNESA
jgi:acyl-CoA dehydrogenase